MAPDNATRDASADEILFKQQTPTLYICKYNVLFFNRVLSSTNNQLFRMMTMLLPRRRYTYARKKKS